MSKQNNSTLLIYNLALNMTVGGEEERSKGEDDEEKRMRVEEEGRRREILGDAGSRNPSRSSVGVEEDEREGEV